MLKKIFFWLCLLLFAMPTQAGAQTTCPNLARSLFLGSRGNEVVALQVFLISQNLLASDLATGYFGHLTKAAVELWQKNKGIVSKGTPETTGYGLVGPRTRKSISQHCIEMESVVRGASSTSVDASVVDGLTIKFEGSLPYTLGAKRIEFGDGTSQGIPFPCGWNQPQDCPLPFLPVSQVHTYPSNGLYLARIKDVVTGDILATIYVDVDSSYVPLSLPRENSLLPRSTDHFVGTPIFGPAPLYATFSCAPYNCSDGTNRYIDFGDGSEIVKMNVSPEYKCWDDASCRPPDFIAEHTYTKPGVYNVVIFKATDTNNLIDTGLAVSSIAVTVSNTSTESGLEFELTADDLTEIQAKLDLRNKQKKFPPVGLSDEKYSVPIGTYEGMKIEERYACTDSCPENGILYLNIVSSTQESCSNLNGNKIYIFGWGRKYLGCSPTENKYSD